MNNIFALPAGVDFATELVRGLRERFAGQPPEAMAQATVYLNSQRMRRRVTEAFAQGKATFLPRLLVLSDLAQHPILSDLPAAPSALARTTSFLQTIRFAPS